jgi:AsmA family protein
MAKPFPATLSRHLLWTLLVIVVVILAICEIIGWPFLRAPAERFMANRLERQVQLDKPFKIHFLGGIHIKAGHFRISAPAGFDAPHLIDASNIVLKLRYSDMMAINNDKTAAVRIKTLQVEKADAYLIRHADGKSTWQFDKDDPNEPSRPVPAIENLVVQDGTAIVNDPMTDSDLKVYFNTREGQGQSATSKVGTSGKFRKIALKAELVTEGFLPIAVQGEHDAPAHSKGWVDYGGVRVDFNGTVSDIFGKKNIKGDLVVKGPSLSTFGLLVNTLLPTTAPFKLEGNIEKTDNLWESNIKSARIGNSDLSGHFKYDPRPEVPKLTGTLKGKRFYLADLAPAFGASGEKDESPDRIFPDRPLDLPSLNKMDALVVIDLDYVELGKAFDRPIAPLKAELDLNKGKMSLAKISAKTADGSLSGVISVDAHQVADKGDTGKKRKSPVELPEWGIDMQWKGINLEKWLKVSNERKATAIKENKQAEKIDNAKTNSTKTNSTETDSAKSNDEQDKPKKNADLPPPYVTGILNGRAKLAGKGNSTADLLGSLNGDVSFYIRHGTLSHLVIEALGLDLAQALGVMIKGDQSLPMQCAVVNLKSRQGIITPDVALIDTPVTLIVSDGHMNLAEERYNLRLVAKPKNVSPFTVRSPILVNGTFLKPDISIEKAPIAARALGAVALAFVNPLAAILPFLDPGSGDDKSPCNQVLAEFNKSAPEKTTAQAQAKAPARASPAVSPIKGH